MERIDRDERVEAAPDPGDDDAGLDGDHDAEASATGVELD
jgi:hypothetical protein